MERLVHKSRTFADADKWDVEQQMGMTPQERMRAARELKFRVYPEDSLDVRQCHPHDRTTLKQDTSQPT